jgi:hypothetical protein
VLKVLLADAAICGRTPGVLSRAWCHETGCEGEHGRQEQQRSREWRIHISP